MNKNIIIRAAVVLSVAIVVVAARWLWITTYPVKVVEPKEIVKNISNEIPIPQEPETTSLSKARLLLSQNKKADAIAILDKQIASTKGTKEAYDALILLAATYNDDGNYVKAKELYQAVIREYADYCDYPKIEKELNSLNIKIIFSPIPGKDSIIYTIVPGDTLGKIAKEYFTTVELIKKANGLTSDTIRPDMKLKIEKDPFSIVVDKSQSSLTLLRNGEVVKTYAVATGMNNSTPIGVFKIKDKLVEPVWYGPNAVVPPDSPENILGSRWLGITTPDPGYGIHGTTAPASIGYQSTAGCVRMLNEDVEEIFAIVPIGVEITIID
ncbi:L,D-transpeptidase family protein [Candidatus Omnitrophota bacterium]